MNEIIHELLKLPPFLVSVIKLGLWLFALSLIFITVERLWSLRAQKIGRKDVLADVFYYFLNNLLPGIVLAFPLALMAVAVHRLLPWPMQLFAVESAKLGAAAGNLFRGPDRFLLGAPLDP